MSETVLKVFGISLICLTLSLILKRWSGDLGVMVKAVAAVVMASLCLVALSPAIDFVVKLADRVAVGAVTQGVGVLMRALAVAFLTHVCASVCRDCGEATLASYVEMAGKAEMLILALPLIENILDTVTKLLG